MIFIRSLIFNILFFIHIFFVSLFFMMSYLFITRRQCLYIAKISTNINQLLLKYVTRTHVTIEGLDNIPKSGCIIAIKHQSSWDTIYFLTCVEDPIFILKHTVFYMPIIGLYCIKQGMIGVNRNSKNLNMKNIINRSREAVKNNRQLIIYPEGTRRSPGEATLYKKGISYIYDSLEVPVIPVVVHAGLFWPRGRFIRYPGHFKVRVLRPIPAKMPRQKFFEELKENMERESDKLLIETINDNPNLPLPTSAQIFYKKLSQ
ncbi:MAG: 1-acyl-sn-glycerol-3-phosphate acyltransferase [Candidatus Liberibacter europaeus]|uniref:1-acyl-sn-glycerol-3-phosphate acyltransferase n=1 Tax=Candidatus Liberibacter europaeus TaxID=744859 RepID=A0A2T4VYF4_9HYPH|nr:1-acyl-sn-glycerol-3-phosphate acyltransferase [Candidatus Liberibacter europaeus]PTL86803.1 MAG: 1-acyl-sn-glycerol-3-phosphate acyltransferase [Candidatus Liberibacter europaeus]